MYIQEIRINGFTSYLAETVVDNFDPGVNVVVGHNGAGKSNFFAAIRFVLSDVTDRAVSDLLYNGRGKRSATSRVEIVFADAGSRFLSEGDTVTIGREIINGTDRYFVNGKQVTKFEARALLDAAGLSYGGNAFFIVPQGDITKLASASDEARLTALLAASGAQTFEDRKQAALKTLEESNSRLGECKQLLTGMEHHLEKVGREADSLREHLEIRKQLRGIEHILLVVEKLRTSLVIAGEESKLEEQREEFDRAAAAVSECEKRLEETRDEASSAEARLSEAEAEFDMAEREFTARQNEVKAAANLAASVSTDYYGGNETFTMGTLPYRGEFMEVDNDRQTLPGEMVDGERDDDERDMDVEETGVRGDDNRPVDPESLANLKQMLGEFQTHLKAVSMKLSASTAQLRALQLKEGRGNLLSPQDRAKARLEAANQVNSLITGLQESLQQETERRRELEELHQSALEKLSKLETQSQEAAEYLAAVSADQQEARQQLSDAESARAMAQLAQQKAEISRKRLEEAADQQTKQLLSISKSSTVRGLRGIRNLVKQLGLSTSSQYFGTVADLLDVQPSVAQAVDRVAGSQMFYHVVDTAETVRKLIDAMEKAPEGSVGSAAFIPLADAIVDPIPEFVEHEGTAPLTSLVKVKDARFEKVKALVFGKYVLCRDLHTAVEYARKNPHPAVTVEGDFCDPRGAMSGGLRADASGVSSGNPHYRHQLIRDLGKLYTDIDEYAEQATEQRHAADKAAQRVTQCVDMLNQTKVRLLKASLARQDATTPVIYEHERAVDLSRKLDVNKATISNIETQILAAEQEKLSVSSESKFAGSLTNAEEEELERLKTKVEKLRLQLDEQSKEECAMATTYQRLKRRYEFQRLAGLQRRTDSLAAEEMGLSTAVDEAERKSGAAREEMVKRKRAMESAQTSMSAAQDKLNAAEESLRAAEHEFKLKSRKFENISVKLRALKNLASDLESKIQQLASVPQFALEEASRYTDANSDTDERALKNVVKDLTVKQKDLNKSLSDLGDVNQRAISDYESYSAEIQSLNAQHDTLENERVEIESTIEVLESQKQEKLDAMLSKVASKFENVFAAMSGGERGSLVVNRDGETGKPRSIGLDVTFGNTAQMSGGQKSLCALALIFSVQACDPAAFYVFDEIDANLDEAARNRVAATVKTISERSGVQFICTTFREELVQAASAWFGVTFEGRESNIKAISKEEAMNFVRSDNAVSQ